MKKPIHWAGWMRVVVTLVMMARGSIAAPTNQWLYPQGSQFCFTFYSTKTNAPKSVLNSGAVTTNDSAYVLTNGATALGPYYGDQTLPLSSAVGYGTRYLYKVSPPCMANTSATVFDSTNWVWPSDQTITNQVIAIVNAAWADTNIAMWDFDTEELRPWKPAELHYFEIVSTAIHASDPARRPVYNYQPNNRDAGTLAAFAPYEDICTKGMYVSSITDDQGHSCMTNRIWARWSMEQELLAIAAANTNAVPWIHLWMMADPPAGYAAMITNWCRHDAYMGLIMGGKGIEVFSGYEGRSGFSDTNFYAYLHGYLTVARDLNGPLHLAPVFLFGQKQTNVNAVINFGPATQPLAYDSMVTNYPSVAFLATAYAGTNYLFAVNSANQTVTAKFSGLPLQNRVDLFGKTTNATPAGSFEATLPAYGVEAFQFIPVPPPVVTRLAMTGPDFTVGGKGADGWNCVLQEASSLAMPVTWVSVATNISGGDTFDFTDSNANGFDERYYRVVLQ